MRVRDFSKRLLASAGVFALTACGSGGSESTNFIPSPPVTPAPTPTPSSSTVTIFPSPAAMEYASVGGSMTIPGGAQSSRFGPISTANADQPHIRYASGGYYEIQLPGKDWDRLVPYKGLVNPTTDNVLFQPAGVAQNIASFATVPARWSGYVYSEYGAWQSLDSGRSGWVAIGIPTAASAIPAAGSATYQGMVHGSADIMQFDGLAGQYFPSAVDGNVTLNFDFLQGALSGGMNLYLVGNVDPIRIGSYNFSETVFAAGSTTYSGRFDTSVTGDNFFLGRFTGPHAEELIGAWAIPFIFTQGDSAIAADGQLHQAAGAWVARKP